MSDPSRRRDALDPDSLAVLEEERDFLLHSLRDLEREYEAGDLDEGDYLALRDDYTHRAAMALAAIDQHHEARRAATAPPHRSRTILSIVGVVVFALLAGFGVARTAGLRTGGAGPTGDVRLTLGQALFRCQELAQLGEVLQALECYDEIIEEHPDNVEALTYRAWTVTAFAGLPEFGWPYLERAVALDQTYSDALAFRAIILNNWCRPEEAIAELDAFDASNPLAEMSALIEGRQIRLQAEELLQVRLDTPEVADPPVPITEAESTEWDQCPVLADAGVLEPAQG